MGFRVATYTTTNGLFDQSQRLQGRYAQVNEQSASGLKSSNFQGIAADTQQLLAVQSQLAGLNAQAQVIQSAKIRVNALKSITNTINTTLSKVSSLLTSVQGGLDITGGAAANAEQARTLREELVSLLNSKSGGDYLFSGSNYDAPPVNLSSGSYNPAAAPGTPDTNYYQGNGVVDTVRAAVGLQIDYGVLATDSAFEKAFRALTIFIADPTNPTTINQSYDLIQQSIVGVAGLNGTLIAKANVIDNQASLNLASTDYYKSVVSGLRDADVAEAAVRTSQIESQLQASFSALSKLLQLRLTDFLR